MAQDHFWTPPDPKKWAPGVLQAMLEICAWGLFAIYQQRGFPLRKYFIPGCVGRGLDLDLRVCPSSSPPSSGNLGCCPFGIEVKKQGFRTAWDIIPGNRSKVSRSWADIESFHTNFSRSSFSCMSKIMGMAGQGDLECESLSWTWDFQNYFV